VLSDTSPVINLVALPDGFWPTGSAVHLGLQEVGDDYNLAETSWTSRCGPAA